MRSLRRTAFGLTAFALASSLLAAPTLALADTWKVDPAHTNVDFKIRHLFTKVSGSFSEFDGTVEFDPAKPETAKVTGTIQAASIDTKNEKRDKHLRGEDFFHVEKYPTITFESTKIEKTGDTTGTMTGDLTMRGVTKPITLAVEFTGAGKDPWGNDKAGFVGTTTIDRKDWGIEWNAALDQGGVVLGDEVEITVSVEANKQ